MDNGYAYLDKYGILHIVSSKSSAPTGSKVVETDVEHDGGFPTVRTDKGMEKVYMYSETEAYVGGNRNSYEAKQAKVLDLRLYSYILDLYRECK